jgi:hypothetical protein
MVVDVHPREVSSTNASPVSLDDMDLCAKITVVLAITGLRELTIIVNNNSHRKGPIMDPWPGPNRGHSMELQYVSMETPNLVLI